MKNYIIRIYRQENDNPKKIVGVVEEPEIEGRKAFTNLDELWGILNPVKAAGVARGFTSHAGSGSHAERRRVAEKTCICIKGMEVVGGIYAGKILI